MTWFVVHFHPGAPLGAPAIAFGPWVDRDLGYRRMDPWRIAPEVREVTEHEERPALPADCLWSEMGVEEEQAITPTRPKFGRLLRPPEPAKEGVHLPLRLTWNQRRLIDRAAAAAGVSSTDWARRVLVKAAEEAVATREVEVEAPKETDPAPEVKEELEAMLRDGLVRRVEAPGKPALWALTPEGAAAAASLRSPTTDPQPDEPSAPAGPTPPPPAITPLPQADRDKPSSRNRLGQKHPQSPIATSSQIVAAMASPVALRRHPEQDVPAPREPTADEIFTF